MIEGPEADIRMRSGQVIAYALDRDCSVFCRGLGLGFGIDASTQSVVARWAMEWWRLSSQRRSHRWDEVDSGGRKCK